VSKALVETSTLVCEGYGQVLPARDLQRCLLTLFRLNPLPKGVDRLLVSLFKPSIKRP
jgi:hypothetical protein